MNRSLPSMRVCLFLVGLVLVGLAAALAGKEYKSGKVWPEPPLLDPGPAGGPPADAIVLFDGRDLAQWEGGDKWLIEDGAAIVRHASIRTRQPFGDCQLHVEWAAPAEVTGSGQGRGNSGVYLMGRYEIQVLDSYENATYPDGQCGALYKQRPPLVNACRPPGQWQTFDIIFQGPRFDQQGNLLRPGHVTVLHNGVLIHNHTQIEGSTAWDRPPAYEPHPEKLPLVLQNHGNPVKYRNIWIREL